MVVKFFANKKGGSSKAVNYLLNHREQEGTARVLQGDPDLTKQIINDIKFKQKTTVGCLSFEEKNISEEMKYQLMADFEKNLLPGMENRYNILWVEHTDKGRLELNFVIPKIDLKTQKSLNPYYHKADLPRVEKWQDLKNLKYEFSNPKDPSKQRTLQTNSKEVGLSKDYEQLDKLLHNLTLEGQIKNRDNLIELLQSNNIEVTRKGKDYLSIKLPDSKKARKFKGGIYHEQFTSTREIENISETAEQRVREYNNRDTQAEQQRLTRELESYTRQKEQKLREIYRVIEPTTGAKDREPKQELNSNTQEQTPKYRGNDRGKTGEGKVPSNNINSNNNINTNSNDNIRDSVLHDKQPIYERQRANALLLHKNDKGEINDSTRPAINERTPTRERLEYQTYLKSRKPRSELLADIEKKSRTIREQSLKDSEELPTINAGNGTELQELFRAEQSRIRELKARTNTLIQTNQDNERELNKFTKLREFGRKLKDTIVDTREWIKGKISLIGDYYKKDFKYKSEPLEKEIKEIKVKKMLGREITVKEVKNLEGVYAKESLLDTIKQEKERTKQRDNSRGHYQSR